MHESIQREGARKTRFGRTGETGSDYLLSPHTKFTFQDLATGKDPSGEPIDKASIVQELDKILKDESVRYIFHFL